MCLNIKISDILLKLQEYFIYFIINFKNIDFIS